MSLDDKPNFAAIGQLQGVAGGQGELDDDFNPWVSLTPHARQDDGVATLKGNDLSGKYVAGTDFARFAGGEQNIAGTDTDAETSACGRAH